MLKFIPVRGRKQIRNMITARFVVEIYPREGTETFFNRPLSHALPLKFIPVRGRKQPILPRLSPAMSWNLSPWGDGNLSHLLIRLYHTQVEIYPREGTETRLHDPLYHTCELKFIPVRGRKPTYQARNLSFSGWNLSPWGDGNRFSMYCTSNS